jgi:hypothetical protein
MNSNYDIDKDYDRWLQEQADLLRDRAFDRLDIDHLIEELEDLVRGEKAAVKNLTRQIIIHQLYVDYWQEEVERNGNHWKAEIVNFQAQLNDKMTTNFKNFLEENLDSIYAEAKKSVQLKTGGKIYLPDQNPYSLPTLIG